MKPNPISLTALLLLACLSMAAQNTSQTKSNSVLLKSGAFTPEKNITDTGIANFNRTAKQIGGRTYAVIQFESIPTEAEKKQLQQSGIELLDYIPNNAYTVTIKGAVNTDLLVQLKARALIDLQPQQKTDPELAKGNFPSWAVKSAGSVDVWISFPRSFTYEMVTTELRDKNFDIISTIYKDYHVIALRISVTRLGELASLPIVEYIESAPHEDVPLNNKSTVNARANLLSSSLPGGRNLRGKGVVIGIGDNADPLQHIDFAGRIIDRTPIFGGAHGVHVTGIAGGGGIIEESFTGYAPKATIISQAFSNVMVYSPAYVLDHGMVITNNSYGNIVDDCNYHGLYDLYSRILDLQSFQMPSLQNVFAAGNSGGMTCGPYARGFHTVLGGYQSAKNIIDVGNTLENGHILDFASSKGPVRDGRIKPEIVAQGTSVVSTWPINIYSFNTGTSMASPAVAGGLALLYEQYRKLHGGLNPPAALMKTLLCNGATDLGNDGPDYTYGFGWMNLLRSVKMMEQNNWFNDSVANTAVNTHSITVPANTGLLKVMLYWNDPAAAVIASHTLVNDLDLELVTPVPITLYPAVLDTLPGNIDNVAVTTGADHINNIEQIVVKNPAAGTYTVRVKGTAITQNPRQEYFLVYDTIPVSTTITYPIGGEHFKTNDSLYVSWDSYGDPINSFTLEFAADGITFSPIGTALADQRQFKWFIPAVITDQARVRITRDATSIGSTSEKFTILGVDTVSLAATQCEGYISINWTAVAGATDYEVMMLQGDEMVPVTTTTATNYTIPGLSKDSVYWVSVRARLNGNPGRRAKAISRQPNTGDCAGAISDNDLKLDAILSPIATGRKFTSTELSNNVPVTIRIKNLDDNVTPGNVIVSYSINAGAPVTQTIINPAIAANGTFNYTFPGSIDLSAIGTYSIQVSVTQTGDLVKQNDSLTKIVKQLDNAPITGLVIPFLDNFETATSQSITTKQSGFDGLDRYDFANSTINGRIRTFVNTGIAYSGSKALTLDVDRFVPGGNTDSLTGTFSLATFNAGTDDIRLDFRYKNHGQVPNAANKVWIRGTDNDNWIQVYDLYANQNDVDGTYKLSSSIELSDLLFNSIPSQNFSTSFQIRFGQWGQLLTADNDGGAGYTFDDIRLYKVTDDIQMISIDTPVVSSCALSSITPVRVSVRNSANSTTATTVPVEFRVDGGAWISENIPPIPGNTTVQYTFTATANLATIGSHLVETRVVYPTDTYSDNDTLSVRIVNSPIIASFPYLENFETGTGAWYTSGKNNSWEYGIPISNKIDRAASGIKAWKTRSAGNYNDQEKSYLYSPCFNVSGMTVPTLSLSIALDLEDCGSGGLCDGAYMEYSQDGKTWNRLGATGQGTNWYNRAYTGNNVWSVQDYTHWHVATIPLPTTGLLTQLRLRFVMASDQSVNKDGIAIDDIHIYDNINGIYTGATMGAPVTQNIAGGTNWIDFTTGGKLIASIQPNNQTMGNTDVQAYIFTGPVRVNNGQYYHHRNITIQPQAGFENLADSTIVRFYFLDNETEALINATGCPSCTKPLSAYDLGVSKYSDANNVVENGTTADDNTGTWKFINSGQAKKVPFDKGYYAEFKVRDFSEFWLNNGGFDRNQPLPVQLIDFIAIKKPNKDVLAEWTTASEFNVNRFEIEVAKGNIEYQQNHFIKIGQVTSAGNSTKEQRYTFTDAELNKSGARYYRLKIIDNDGSSHYSAIRPVVFNDNITWQVYPNPSQGLFNLSYQANAGDIISIKVYDVNGKAVQTYTAQANGFVQKTNIDLHAPTFATGLYLLEASIGDTKQVFRLIKQ